MLHKLSIVYRSNQSKRNEYIYLNNKAVAEYCVVAFIIATI